MKIAGVNRQEARNHDLLRSRIKVDQSYQDDSKYLVKKTHVMSFS